MPETLQKVGQDDFSGGGYPGFDRDEIPQNAFEDALNCLVDDDGLPYLRGGSAYVSDAPGSLLGTYPARMLWEGYLAAGRQSILIAEQAGPVHTQYRINPSDDHTPDALSALAPSVTSLLGNKPVLWGGRLYWPGGWGWAGAGPTAPAVTLGTSITFTQGSTTAVGVGTSWATSPSAAGVALIDTPNAREVIVSSITDATHLELTEPWLDPTVTLSSIGSSRYPDLGGPSGKPSLLGCYILGSVGDRVLGSSGGSAMAAKIPQNRVMMSDRHKPRSVQATNFWDLPSGVVVRGIESLRDTAVVFASHGVWAIYNVSLDLTDASGNPQQRLQQLTRELVLWSWAGVANFESGLIVPAMDGIYYFNPTTGADEIGQAIKQLYLSYVAAGYIAGAATVFNGHYVLPIIDSSGAPIDVLTCRLHPTRRGPVRAWTRQAAPMRFVSMAVRSTPGGVQLRGLEATTARIVKCDWWAAPTASPITDSDGSYPQATITTREFKLNTVKNFLARLKARYELAGTSVSLTAAAGVDSAATGALTGAAAAGTIANPKIWTVGKRGYGVRIVLTTAGQVSKFVLHSLEAFFLPSGKST